MGFEPMVLFREQIKSLSPSTAWLTTQKKFKSEYGGCCEIRTHDVVSDQD